MSSEIYKNYFVPIDEIFKVSVRHVFQDNAVVIFLENRRIQLDNVRMVQFVWLRLAFKLNMSSATNKRTNASVSRLAKRKSHHTALSNAAAPNSECSCQAPAQTFRRSHSSRNFVMPPPPWLPASQSTPEGEKTCLDSRPTSTQNFMPLSFSAAEKSVTVQKNKMTKSTQ